VFAIKPPFVKREAKTRVMVNRHLLQTETRKTTLGLRQYKKAFYKQDSKKNEHGKAR